MYQVSIYTQVFFTVEHYMTGFPRWPSGDWGGASAPPESFIPAPLSFTIFRRVLSMCRLHVVPR